MYKCVFPLVACLALSGCQQLSKVQQSATANVTDSASEDTNNNFIAAEVSTDELANISDVTNSEPQTQSNKESALVYGDVWKRIQAQLNFPIPNNRRLQIQRTWYAKHPDYLNRVAKRAEPFLYYIVGEIEKRGLPMELALLPIVESAFDPYAHSHVNASGLWQFVPGTAKHFGLAQNWWYDGRRDVIAATKAALDYLERLNKQFDGNWLHALAAYNSGEGRVARAIQKNYRAGENIDYWSLELPRETDAYVPKLLALADIFKRPYKYDLTLYKIPNVQTLDVVELDRQIDLSLAGKLIDMPVKDIKALNPGYDQWATSPDGPHRFLLPIEKAELLARKVKALPANELMTWTRYKIQRGDSLSKIAEKYKTTMAVIRKANKIKGNNIRAGSYLLIPGHDASASQIAEVSQAAQTKSVSTSETNDIEYIVKSGDSFWEISQKHKVSIKEITKWNNLSANASIFPGQILIIKRKDGQITGFEPGTDTQKVKYKVRPGDSLARIAQKFKVSIKDIEAWNKINRKKYLQPGQMLDLHVNTSQI
ncbi:LysM peptidoglycan-binding domain-containing protein [Catenovulum adriaticum]|uniref:LysM peptidoglycan-binding domain-containing protein n=1 Tax=Catenovulum adriaticum TaxID=2984846 RepID=A0ABY7ANZ2_9ALTE|nr:LysM peptidoglycan-binding domain-containing protein [Catenovulum sp. TS8]WAJ70943.1 LysM peptidoglycan-binding domain-containing protein [Catenovulum sp. TS8]